MGDAFTAIGRQPGRAVESNNEGEGFGEFPAIPPHELRQLYRQRPPSDSVVVRSGQDGNPQDAAVAPGQCRCHRRVPGVVSVGDEPELLEEFPDLGVLDLGEDEFAGQWAAREFDLFAVAKSAGRREQLADVVG